MTYSETIDVEIVQGGMIANVYLDRLSGSFEHKTNMWTQVYPFPAPIRGCIAFNFHNDDNHLIGVQIFYAKFCLHEQYAHYAEYMTQNETIEAGLYVDSTDQVVICIYLSDVRKKFTSGKFLEFADPASGHVSLDFHQSRLASIEFVNCDTKIPEKT